MCAGCGALVSRGSLLDSSFFLLLLVRWAGRRHDDAPCGEESVAGSHDGSLLRCPLFDAGIGIQRAPLWRKLASAGQGAGGFIRKQGDSLGGWSPFHAGMESNHNCEFKTFKVSTRASPGWSFARCGRTTFVTHPSPSHSCCSYFWWPQLFPMEGMGLSFKWPGSDRGGSEDRYHASREQYHEERIRYHEERLKHHRLNATAPRSPRPLCPAAATSTPIPFENESA